MSDQSHLFPDVVPAPAPAAAKPHSPDPEQLAILETLVAPSCRPGRAGGLATRLLAAFGDLGGVISAPEVRLAAVAGWEGRAVAPLKAVEAAARAMARADLRERTVLTCWPALVSYLRVAMAHHSTERMRVLFLDRRNALIADEEMGHGTVDHVPLYPREVIRRALELDASALILAHNHPSGEPDPSPDDIGMTRAVQSAAEALGLVLHDHVVVGRGRETSFRALGLLGSAVE